MPPKRAAAGSSKSTTTKTTKAAATKATTEQLATKKLTTRPKPAKATVDDDAPVTNGTSSKAATTKRKSTSTKAPPVKATSKTSKRKSDEVAAEEDDEEDEEMAKGIVKRQRTESPGPASKRTKTAMKKPALKKPAATKKKTIINTAPTTRLNVYVFGDGSNGELGLGNAKGQTEVKRPRLNPLLDADKVGVVSLAVGGMHSVVLTHDNRILSWGVNDQGALGRDTAGEGGLRDMDDNASDADSDDDSQTGVNPYESTPTEIDTTDIPEGTVFTQLAASDSATFALTDEGNVYGWGTFRGNEGIFGFNTSVLIQRTPLLIDKLTKITQIAAGANHILALQSNGVVFAWGTGQQNQLGRRILERTKINSLIPTQFGLPKKMVGVGAGAYHSFAMHENGDVYSWGLNSYGETGQSQFIGEGGEADVHHPTIIEALRGKGKVKVIEGGAHHTVAVTDRGELFVWGRVDGYQLGLDVTKLPEDQVIKDSAGHARILTTPTQIPNIDAVYAAAGSDHCVAVAKDGKAYAWGFSATYQTGLGTEDDVEIITHIDNTATRGKKLVWAGAGGQFSVLAGVAEQKDAAMTNGH